MLTKAAFNQKYSKITVNIIRSVFYIYICDPGPQNQSYVAGVYCSNSLQYIAWVKMIDFSFMPEIIRILVKIISHEDIL